MIVSNNNEAGFQDETKQRPIIHEDDVDTEQFGRSLCRSSEKICV